MKYIATVVLNLLFVAGACQADLTPLNDRTMEQASAQSGITIELSANISAGSMADFVFTC
jgi:hypothetical protein